MCSPLVIAASGKGRNAIFRNLQYNLGRILTYGILGSVVGLAGKGLHVAGLQQWTSIAAGLALLVIGITNMRFASPAILHRHIFQITNVLKARFRQVLNSRNTFGMVMLGMLNGILPCGMTLVAMGYCVTLTGPWDGFVAMLLFGLGTLPAMVGFSSIAKSLVSRLKIGYSTLQAGLIIVCAIVLIGRGIWNDDYSKSHATHSDGIVICGSEDAR